MPVAGADREAEAGVQFCRLIEIAHRMHDVIQTARHRVIPLLIPPAAAESGPDRV
jgi:hypothetical protein